MVDAVRISETPVSYETTRHDIPEVCHLYTRCREDQNVTYQNSYGDRE
jgi:hypothetical protein